MRKTYGIVVLFVASMILSSCGTAQGVGQTLQRTMQTVGRTLR
jgi:predicted small secreted protein